MSIQILGLTTTLHIPDVQVGHGLSVVASGLTIIMGLNLLKVNYCTK
jgi:hypothetical protein